MRDSIPGRLTAASALLAALLVLPSSALALASAASLLETIDLEFGPRTGPGDRIGMAVAAVGDLDGDGIDEIAVSAAGIDDGGDYAGAVYLFFFDRSGRLRGDQKLSASAGGVSPAPQALERFGWSLAPLGDLDGDGVPDLAVGSAMTTGGGKVWILLLNTDGTVKSSSVITAGQNGFTGPLSDDSRFGGALATLGDLDGGGTIELAVSAIGDDEVASNGGAVWILSLDGAGVVVAESKIVPSAASPFLEQDEDGYFGVSLARLADRNGDGRPELAIGVAGDNLASPNDGALYVASLDAAAVVTAVKRYDATTPALVGLFDNYDGFAASVADAGDLDGNGFRDLLVGIADKDINTTSVAFDQGSVVAAYVDAAGDILSVAEISIDQGDIEATQHFQDHFGTSIALIGDVDGDGSDEIAIGAPATLREDGSKQYGGRLFLVEVDASFAVVGQREIDFDSGVIGVLTAGEDLGVVGCGPGDLAADGESDVWLGSPGTEPSGDVVVLARDAAGRGARYRAVASSDAALAAAMPAGARFGASVAMLPDLDADTIPEIVAGAPADPGGGSGRGSVWIVRTDAEGTTHAFSRIGEGTGGFSGTLADADAFGSAVAVVADLDSNGTDEIVAGAAGSDTGAGALWVLFLDAAGSVVGQRRIDGSEPALAGMLAPGDEFGATLVALGDVDGDGNDDVAVGAPGADRAATNDGAVFVLFLLPDGSVREAARISAGENGWEHPPTDGMRLGSLLLTLGDRDGDAIADLVVASPSLAYGGSQTDQHMLFLAGDGRVRLQHRIAGEYYLTTGLLRDGFAFAAGDVSGDGAVDMITRDLNYGSLYAASLGSRCGPEPLAGCRGAQQHGFSIRNRAENSSDSLLWKWDDGDQTDFADFALPEDLETYAVCIWDGRGGDYHLMSEAVLPPFDREHWIRDLTTRLEWRANSQNAVDGVRLIKLLAKEQGRARMKVKARGELWPAPRGVDPASIFALDPELVIQLRDESGECWESRYSALDRNEAERASGSFP